MSSISLTYLPREVTITILSKLPSKAILRLKVVCKEWLDIVTSDPIFAKTHYENNFTTLNLVCREREIMNAYKKKPNVSMLQRWIASWSYRVVDPYRFVDIVALGESWYGFDVVNSCKGFLLMWGWSHTLGDTYVVYNPLTNETVFLPKLSKMESFSESCALGFSPVTKQFKVVVLTSFPRQSLQICTLNGGKITGAWRTALLPERNLRFDIIESWKNTLIELNGVLHWRPTICRIVCFDVEKEEFCELSTPYIREISSYEYKNSIGVYRGLLCLGNIIKDSWQVEMWVMKEYGIKESWMRLVVVDLKKASATSFEPYLKFSTPKLMEILDTGEIIFRVLTSFLSHSCYSLFSFDPINECFTKSPFYSDMTIDIYTPSFFSIKDF